MKTQKSVGQHAMPTMGPWDHPPSNLQTTVGARENAQGVNFSLHMKHTQLTKHFHQPVFV